jgi:ABC-type sugar transport system substrate-binding protein
LNFTQKFPNRFNCILLIFCVFLAIPKSLAQPSNLEPSPSILFIYPVDKGFPFWDSQVNFAQAVADALNFELEIAYTPQAYRNRFGAAEFLEKILESKETSPKLVISSFWVGSEKQILTLLNMKKIPLISINSDISTEQFAVLGKPREKFPYWLAQISPNDFAVGGQLATAILQGSRARRCPTTKCNVNIFAITGMSYSAVSTQRVNGLKQVVQTDKNSRILNAVYGHWDRKRVADMTSTILSRHNDIDAFWIASDIMAYGLLDGLNAMNHTLPSTTIIGSIDWSPASIDKVKEGSLHMSVGGHFMEAGWSLILFYDYINNTDFADELGVIIRTEMSLLNKQNVDTLGPFLQAPSWSKKRIRSYSKYLNPARKHYNLTPTTIIMEQLEQSESSKSVPSI